MLWQQKLADGVDPNAPAAAVNTEAEMSAEATLEGATEMEVEATQSDLPDFIKPEPFATPQIQMSDAGGSIPDLSEAASLGTQVADFSSSIEVPEVGDFSALEGLDGVKDAAAKFTEAGGTLAEAAGKPFEGASAGISTAVESVGSSVGLT